MQNLEKGDPAMTTTVFSKVRMFITVFALVTAGMTGMAHADMLTGNMTNESLRSFFKFRDDGHWYYAAPIEGENLTTGQVMNLFCTDHYTYTTPDFENPKLGQPYNPVALNSPTMTLYSNAQIAALNSLFSHVYGTIVDADDNLLNNASGWAFQLAVWEIVHETSSKWSLSSGSFGISSAMTYSKPNLTGAQTDNALYWEVISLTDSWFAAIANESLWGSKYPKSDIELTVYVAEGGTHVSQTMISTVGPPKNVTPEPASLLIVASGLALLPFTRRKRNPQ